MGAAEWCELFLHFVKTLILLAPRIRFNTHLTQTLILPPRDRAPVLLLIPIFKPVRHFLGNKKNNKKLQLSQCHLDPLSIVHKRRIFDPRTNFF